LEAVRGEVSALRKGARTAVPVKTGDSLGFADEVRTSSGALAHVAFPNGGIVLVKGGSSFVIGGNVQRPRLFFPIGEFLIGFKRKLQSGHHLRVRTPSAVAAVRGTLFWGKSDEKKESVFACFDGSITVEAEGATVVLEPGQKVRIPFGSPPTEVGPADIPLSYVDTFSVDGSLQGLDELLKK